MIVEWVIIGLFAFIGFMFFKMEHHTRKVKILLVIVVGLVLYFSIAGVFSSDKVDLASPRGIVNAVYVYFGWMGETAGNLWDIGVDTTSLVGNAIKINHSEQRR